MEISLVEERAFRLEEKLTFAEAEAKAWERRLDAFGRISKVASLVQRRKDEDINLIYKETRLQPFWHIECAARYVYQRSRDFPIPISGPEVETVTLEGMEYQVTEGSFSLSGVEHCREEFDRDVFIDGLTGQENEDLKAYLDNPAEEIPDNKLEGLASEDIIVVPPQARASAIVREVLIGMIKSVQADRILEDTVEVRRVDLYYRPVYAFQYRWPAKEKEAVLAYDGVTGELEAGSKTFQQYMGKILEPDFLFDVGVETIDLFVPGGGIAIKIAKKGIDVARKK